MCQLRAVSLSLGRAPLLRLPLASQCTPMLVAWYDCVLSPRLRDAFTKLSVPSHPLSHCPSLEGEGMYPSEAAADPPLLAAALPELVSSECPGAGCGQAGCGAGRSAGGPVNVCVRWRFVL